MGEVSGWIDSAIWMGFWIAVAIVVYGFLGWLLWEYIIFPLFS
jgi:hypothetical protein